MLEELGLGRILAVHGAVLGVHGGLALEEVLLGALPEPAVSQAASSWASREHFSL